MEWPRKSPHFMAVCSSVRSLRARHSRPIVVGLSGGADSLALTLALAFLRYDAHAVSVNHNLQPHSAEISARAVDQARACGLTAEVVDVEIAPAGRGMEAAARDKRYEALTAVARERGADVWVAHTLDDQAEQCILGAVRGRVNAMPECRPLAEGVDLCRPLLACRRSTTRLALQELNIQPWNDPHNVDPRYTRVRIRREVIPLLEDIIGGDPAPALARAATLAAQDSAAVDELMERTGVGEGSVDTTGLPAYKEYPRAVRVRAIVHFLREYGGSVSAATIDAVDDLITNWHGQGSVAIGRAPGGGRLVAVRRGSTISVKPAQSRAPMIDTSVKKVAMNPITDINRSVDIPAGKYREDIEAVLISEEEIQSRIVELAHTVSEEYREVGEDLVLVCVLKGAVFFMTDFARALEIPAQLEFMAVSSYGNATSSSGVVRILKDLDRDIEGKHVLIVEDIIDSGLTLSWLMKNLVHRHPASLKVVTLLRKPEAVRVEVDILDVGFDIPTEFVVGYGLDYAERYRDLPYVGLLKPSVYE